MRRNNVRNNSSMRKTRFRHPRASPAIYVWVARGHVMHSTEGLRGAPHRRTRIWRIVIVTLLIAAVGEPIVMYLTLVRGKGAAAGSRRAHTPCESRAGRQSARLSSGDSLAGRTASPPVRSVPAPRSRGSSSSASGRARRRCSRGGCCPGCGPASDRPGQGSRRGRAGKRRQAGRRRTHFHLAVRRDLRCCSFLSPRAAVEILGCVVLAMAEGLPR